VGYQQHTESAPATPPDFGAALDLRDAELIGLLASCIPRLSVVARRMMKNVEDAEDVLQEGLLSAFQKLNQFEGRSKFSTWLHTVVVNTAKMHIRKRGLYRSYSIEQESNDNGLSILDTLADRSHDAEELLVERERSQILQDIVRGLRPSYRAVVQLCDIEGLGGNEAAARLGISISHLKTDLHRARRQVAKRIREKCRIEGQNQPTPHAENGPAL
jgi:RNA polymerase sigma-70 factor (ECF subfamily)